MKQPSEPKKEDCCNSGCNPCIFDVYEKQMRLYQSYKCGEISNLPVENAISQLEYSPFYVIKNIDICKQHNLLLFKQKEMVTGKHVLWNPGEHFLVKYSFAKKSCTRAYTPLKIEQLDEEYDFAIIVKRYCNGLVSNYLCDLNVGELTLWRGPYGHYQYIVDSGRFCRIIMVAQGTGIAPLFSVIKNILSNEDNMTKIILFYCCKCIETILLRNELYSFKSYWNFEYSVYLSKKLNKNTLKYREPILTDKLSLIDLIKLKPFTETDQFLLCGSEEFMNCFKKLLQNENVRNNYIVTF